MSPSLAHPPDPDEDEQVEIITFQINRWFGEHEHPHDIELCAGDIAEALNNRRNDLLADELGAPRLRNNSNVTPVVTTILEVLNGWLPPIDDIDLDYPEYFINCAADIASHLRVAPTNDPRVWRIFIVDPCPDFSRDLLRSIRDSLDDDADA